MAPVASEIDPRLRLLSGGPGRPNRATETPQLERRAAAFGHVPWCEADGRT